MSPETCRQDVDVYGCYRSLPNLAVWLKDCAIFAGEDRDWAMCHVGEKYQHLSLCSEGFGSLKETLNYLKFNSLCGMASVCFLSVAEVWSNRAHVIEYSPEYCLSTLTLVTYSILWFHGYTMFFTLNCVADWNPHMTRTIASLLPLWSRRIKTLRSSSQCEILSFSWLGRFAVCLWSGLLYTIEHSMLGKLNCRTPASRWHVYFSSTSLF